MTTTDKTGDQLAASIRKSKSGTVARKSTAKKTQAKQRRAAGKTRTPAKKDADRPSVSPSVDTYRVGRRVWPD